MVENANSRFWIIVVVLDTVRLSTGSLPSSVDEKPTTSTANFFAFEGLQSLIRENEELTSERDQLLSEQNKTSARLSELEARAAEAIVLEARLQQSEQKIETLNQEIAPFRAQFEEARAKCVENHNTVLAAFDREAASAERLNNLEATLNSKTEELAAAGVKYGQLEEKHKKTIEHNRLLTSIVCDLDVSLQSVRFVRENLSAEVDQLKEKLKHRAASLIVEKNICCIQHEEKILRRG
ncbi:uncharacterized protein [Nicotiana sylvestris]|uniref:uncharacterized protein n=1 Tax=Nicotiana sylvestris TaxID=4096 RepID=UPI00388CB981